MKALAESARLATQYPQVSLRKASTSTPLLVLKAPCPSYRNMKQKSVSHFGLLEHVYVAVDGAHCLCAYSNPVNLEGRSILVPLATEFQNRCPLPACPPLAPKHNHSPENVSTKTVTHGQPERKSSPWVIIIL